MIVISQAKVSDSQEIRRLENKIWKEEVVNKFDIPMFVRFGWCFVAKDNKKIIGAICSFPTRENEVYVSDVVVEKKYRRTRIGWRLYERLFKALKGKRFLGFIDPKNSVSLEFHKKLGFKAVAEVENAYDLKSGLEGGKKILMKR